MEQSLVILKPDTLQRGLVGRIIARLEDKGLKLISIKMTQLDDDILNEHYAHLTHLPFFQDIKEFMLSTPVIITCWEGLDCVATIRQLVGITKARDAEPGTIRGDWAMSVQSNLVHASDTTENATIEVHRFLEKEEIYNYSFLTLPYLYASGELSDK